jgi:DNA-binding Xre family transcriptional regulator
MPIYTQIKKHLEENGIKHMYIAKLLGITESKLSLMLGGKRKISLEEYEFICYVLGVGVDKFMQPKKLEKWGA